MCGLKSQSPVDLVSAIPDPTLTFPVLNKPVGGCSKWVQFADDHVLEIDFETHGCDHSVTYKGKDYNLIQAHFHRQSEHAVGGGYADAEMHLVHQSSDNKYLAMGVRLLASADRNSKSHVFLGEMWAKAAVQENIIVSNKNADKLKLKEAVMYVTQVNATTPIESIYDVLLPASHNFFTYSGSLTTYPCTEGVTWIVFEQPIIISQLDLYLTYASVSNNTFNVLSPDGK